MLEYLIPSLMAELAPNKTLIPATLRVRLPHLTSNILGVSDLRILNGEVRDQYNRGWLTTYDDMCAIALRKVGHQIYALLSNSHEIMIGTETWISQPSDLQQYLLKGFRPPPANPETKRRRLL
jgi:hypothetical protein